MDNASRVELNQNINLNFSEDVIAGSGNINLFEENGVLVESFKVSPSIISGSTVILKPAADLKYNSAYFIQISATALTDTAGNAYVGIVNDTELNFKTRQKSLKEEFSEVQDEIRNTIKSNTNKQISIFLKSTNTVVSSARDRFISNHQTSSGFELINQSSGESFRIERDSDLSSNRPNGFVNTSLIDKDTKSDFHLRSSTRGTSANGQINGLLQSDDGRAKRYTGLKFSYTNSASGAEIGSASSQVTFERERANNLTVGRFIGSSLSKYSKIDTNTSGMGLIIESVALQFGSYFIENIAETIFLDGYIAGALLANKLEVETTSIIADSYYVSRMGAAGLSMTGSLPLDHLEIRPTLALGYSAVSSEKAKFEVGSEAGNSIEIITHGNERQLNLTFTTDFRKSFDFKENNRAQDSIISFKPKVNCQRINRDIVTKHCGQGATIDFSLQDKNSMERLFVILGVDKISETTTYSANAFYKIEF